MPSGADSEGAYQESVHVASPPPGTQLVRTTPGETYEQVLSGRFVLATSAAAGSREALIIVEDPNGVTVSQVSAPAAQGPGITLSYTIDGTGRLQYAFPNGGAVIGLPPLLLLPGYQIFVVIGAMDAADQISNVGLLLLRVPTGAPPRIREPLVATPITV